jgi:hypothetical protein
LFFAAAPLRAQAPTGADTLSQRAIAESLKVLDKLGTQVKDHPKDAALWYHRAMVAFALAERAGKKDVPELSDGKMRILAGDSFVAAVNLDPKNQL